MNFRDLKYIVTAGKLLSFSKAAKECNVSQPSLSAQIKKIEEQFGEDIFIRSKRKIYVSEFGKEFIALAESVLATQEEMKNLAAACKNPLTGSFTLGGILTVAPYLFPQIVRTINENAPQIKLTLQEAKTDDLLKALLNGEIDAALISLPTDEHVFDSAELLDEAFYFAAPEDHDLANKKTISIDDLNGETLILLDEGHCFREQTLDICRTAAAQENEMFRATSLETIRHFVSIGEGVTLMPEMAKRGNDGIAYIPMDRTEFSRKIGLVWHKSSNKKPQIEKIIAMMKSVV